MKIPGKITYYIIFLFTVASALSHAESITTLYNIDFNAPTHISGEQPTYGPFEPSCNVIQSYFAYDFTTQPPVVVDEFDGLTDQPCLFYIDPNQTNPPNGSFIKLEMFEDYDSEARIYPRYKIEMDILIDSLFYEEDIFAVGFKKGYVIFHSDGRVSDINSNTASTDYNFNQIIHLRIDINLTLDQYSVSIDDNVIFTGGLISWAEFNEIEIFFLDSLSVGNKAAIDNLFVYGIDEQPELQITKPKIGEGFSIGKTVPVTWYSSSDVGDITIEYSTDSGSTWMDVSPLNIGNEGVYNWTIPDTPSNFCKLRLTNSGTGLQAESNIFRICPPVPDLPSYEVIYLDEVFGQYANPMQINDDGDFLAGDPVISQIAWIDGELISFDDYR